MTCAGFSQDSTLMAVGFSESYIKLWNLKGEKLRGMRSDFQAAAVKDGRPYSPSPASFLAHLLFRILNDRCFRP